MVLYPEAMRKAQEELDRVVGKERLPSIEDKDSLPYVSAMVKEAMRYNPPSPLGSCSQISPFLRFYILACTVGIPHRNIKADIYRGTIKGEFLSP